MSNSSFKDDMSSMDRRMAEADAVDVGLRAGAVTMEEHQDRIHQLEDQGVARDLIRDRELDAERPLEPTEADLRDAWAEREIQVDNDFLDAILDGRAPEPDPLGRTHEPPEPPKFIADAAGLVPVDRDLSPEQLAATIHNPEWKGQDHEMEPDYYGR